MSPVSYLVVLLSVVGGRTDGGVLLAVLLLLSLLLFLMRESPSTVTSDRCGSIRVAGRFVIGRESPFAMWMHISSGQFGIMNGLAKWCRVSFMTQWMVGELTMKVPAVAVRG